VTVSSALSSYINGQTGSGLPFYPLYPEKGEQRGGFTTGARLLGKSPFRNLKAQARDGDPWGDFRRLAGFS